MKKRLLAAFVVSLGMSGIVDGAARDITIPAGTQLRVKLDNSVGSDLSRVEDTVRGRLVSPIVMDGRTVLTSGAPLVGSVTQAVRSGKVKGRATLGLRFHSLTAADHEQYRISTRTWTSDFSSSEKVKGLPPRISPL